jgi:hypothetical protein
MNAVIAQITAPEHARKIHTCRSCRVWRTGVGGTSELVRSETTTTGDRRGGHDSGGRQCPRALGRGHPDCAVQPSQSRHDGEQFCVQRKHQQRPDGDRDHIVWEAQAPTLRATGDSAVDAVRGGTAGPFVDTARPSPVPTTTYRSTTGKPVKGANVVATMSEQGLQPSSGLLGRAHECAAVDRLLEGVRRGRSGSLVVRGEAGIGKTALLAYAAERARENMTVLAVTGVEGESDLAFAGLHGLLFPIVDALEGVPAPQREPLAAALGLAPGEGRDRFLVSAGVLSLLAAAAESRPILCLVDDAQWLDVPSANALSFTARRLLAEDVVILFGVRDGEARRFDAAGLDEIEVAGLDRDAAALVLDQSARQAAASVRERLLADAAGNPLALLELPAGLSDAQLDGGAPLPDALPVTDRLRSAFSQRIERLSEPTRAALLIAAAEEAGELAVTLRAAAELGLPPDALDPAEEAGLVRIDGTALASAIPSYGRSSTSRCR